MQISKNFTLEEFINSDTAKRMGIDNSPSQEIVDNIRLLVDTILLPLRDNISHPFIINSGYRCSDLNKAVGGSVRSAHLKGLAADVTLGSKLLNKILYNEITKGNYTFDLAINEKDYSWIHIGIKPDFNRLLVFSIS